MYVFLFLYRVIYLFFFYLINEYFYRYWIINFKLFMFNVKYVVRNILFCICLYLVYFIYVFGMEIVLCYFLIGKVVLKCFV